MSDDELLLYAKRGIAKEHGLDERDAHRLVGSTAAEPHADAKAMAKEVGTSTRPSEHAMTAQLPARADRAGRARARVHEQLVNLMVAGRSK